MKRRILYLTLLVAVLSALACYLLVFHEPPEPGYQGKSFSAWAEIYYQGTSNDVFEGDNWHPQPVRDAENALRQIGTNAIPTLLRMLRAHDAEWKLKVLAVLQKQHLMKFKHVTATGRNLEAEIVFHLLGASASNAVPALIEIFDQKPFGSSQYAAGSALGYIGPPAMAAIPALLRGATNQDPACRGCSVLALGQIHGDPDSVLPVLIQSLKDTNRYVVLAAFRGIGNFGPEARMAVPALLPMVTNSPSWLAVNVLSSLRQIQAAPGVMVPALVACLDQPDRNLRNSSIDYLGSLGNDAQPALSALLEMCGDRDVSVKRAALNAVARIDGTNPAVILVLSQALKDEHFEIKMIAASSLGDIGPPAVSAVPELVHAQTNAEPQFWSILAKALKKIDPDGTARAAVK